MSQPPLSASNWQDLQEELLAPYAMRSRFSRGRRHRELEHPYRSIYQRDRERIVHCTAFRRMTGKTQVLVASVNDHHRTRLTHTLEVCQVARTVARRLRLNEDLVEAIALAHDIGHPPFGHAGESALDDCLKSFGGFNHNLFGLRRVDELEERYPDFPGLNLSFEVREAFVHHAGRRIPVTPDEFQGNGSPLIEAQVVEVVDSIAYDTHDIDDALGLELISLGDLKGVEFWDHASRRVSELIPGLSGNPFRTAVLRELLSWQVSDLLAETEQRLMKHEISSIEGVRAAPTPLVGFSSDLITLKAGLELFLRERVYKHHRVLRMTANGKRILRALFTEYVRSPELLPEKHLRRWNEADSVIGPPPPGWVTANRQPTGCLRRVVGDYLAGMTDRFAQLEYRRLFLPAIEL